jgi:hypothetical protein
MTPSIAHLMLRSRPRVRALRGPRTGPAASRSTDGAFAALAIQFPDGLEGRCRGASAPPSTQALCRDDDVEEVVRHVKGYLTIDDMP